MINLQEYLSNLEKLKAPAWLFDDERSLIIWANEAGITFWNEETLFDLVDRKLNREISDLDNISAIKSILEEKTEEDPLSQSSTNLNNLSDDELISSFSFYPSDEKISINCKCILVTLEDDRRGILLIAILDEEQKSNENISNYNFADNNFFETIYNLLPQELGVFDIEGNLLFANQALSDNFDILLVKNGKKAISNLFDIIGDEDKAISILKRTKDHLSLNLGLRIENKFGNRFHRIKSQLVEYDTKQYILVSFYDQDDRRKLERSLVAENNKLNELISNASDFYWSTDMDHNITDISDNFYDIFKLSKSEVIGKSWFLILSKLNSVYDEHLLLDKLSHKKNWRSDNIVISIGKESERTHKTLYLNASVLIGDERKFEGYFGSGVFYNSEKIFNNVNATEQSNIAAKEADIVEVSKADIDNKEALEEVTVIKEVKNQDELSTDKNKNFDNKIENETDEASEINKNLDNEKSKGFAGNLNDKDKTTFKSLGSSLKNKVDSDNKKADEKPIDEEAINDSAVEVKNDDEVAKADKSDELEVTEADDETQDEISEELIGKPTDLKNVSEGGDDFVLYITHRHYKESKFAVLLHRNFEILDCNKAFVELLGFKNIDEVIAKRNLMSLFPDEKMRLFNLQSEIENWKNSDADNSSNQYKFKLKYNLLDGETITLNSSARQVMWNNEKIIYMGFSKVDEFLISDEEALSKNDESSKNEEVTDQAPKISQVSKTSSEENVQKYDKANISNFPSKYENNIIDFQNIMDEVGEGILIFEKDGKIIQSNKSSENLLNAGDKIININLYEILPESNKKQLTSIVNAISSGQKEGHFENSFELSQSFEDDNGEIENNVGKDLIFTITKSNDEKGNLSAVIQDISKWKKAEKELINARVNAENESHKKSDMLARISHEIRTPLNSILGFSEVMTSEQFGPMVNDRYKEYVSDIKSSSELLLSLINNLLDLNRVEKGKFELNFVSVSLRMLVRKIYSMVKFEAAEKKLLVRINIEDELPDIVADEISMKQIILNLLSNSIKYTKAGGQIVITGAKTNDGEIMLSIKDTGIGMSEDELVIAMEPYRRIEEHKHSSIKGTGLGLPLTKALVEANRASFSIKSEKGKGTQATVTFPTNRVLEY